MQKDNVFFKDFSSGFIVAGLAFTVFFATALFFELAIGSVFNVEPSQDRISLVVGFFMAVGVGFFLFSKNKVLHSKDFSLNTLHEFVLSQNTFR